MDRLQTMRIFVAVGEAASFAGAARALGLSAPAVTRAVGALERRVGVRLLTRTTRVVRLTEIGAAYLADCKRILAAVAEAEASAGSAHAVPRGRVEVTAPVMFGRMYVAPLVVDFLAAYPATAVRLLLSDRVVNIAEAGLDVAVRIADLPDSTLSASRIGAVRRVTCASPAYLARRGEPRAPAELVGHDAIAFSPARGAPDVWTFSSRRRAESVAPPARLVVNNADVALAAALAGHGITRLLSYQTAPHVRAGRLKIILVGFEPAPLPIHVVHALGRQAPAKVRAFVEFAVRRLRADPLLR